LRVATRIGAGTVWVNTHLDVRLDTPLAGAKQSGIGTELGQEGLDGFTQATVINVAKESPTPPAGSQHHQPIF